MSNRSSVWLGMALCSVQLLSAGCGGGGGGLFGLFGGSGDSGAGDLFSALVSGGSDVAGGAGGGAAGPLTLASDVATVHSPEPASVALFGIGLAGLAHARRRTTKRSKAATR